MRWIALAVAVAVSGSLMACDPELTGTGGPAPGPVCYTDDDCVPADCCGEGASVTHVSRAPSCFGVACNTNCNPQMISCGCGIPICRDGRCAPAVMSCGSEP